MYLTLIFSVNYINNLKQNMMSYKYVITLGEFMKVFRIYDGCHNL